MTVWRAGVDARLGAGGRLLDAHLGDALLDRRGHAAGPLGLLDVGPGALGEVVGELLDVVGAGPRVDDLRGAATPAAAAAGCCGRCARRSRSGSAIASSSALVCSDCVWPWVAAIASMQVRPHVVEDVLRGQRPAGGLAVRAQRQRLGVLRVEVVDQPRPQRAGRAHLGDLHEEVHADRPEERQPRRELVDRQARVEAGADVLDAVGERVRQLEVGRRPGLLDVVAGDRDRVEARHLLRGEREDVADDPHARRRRVDVGVADHELLEDVVLDGPRELLRLHPLLLGRHDVEREHRQHGAVHRHRHRHLVERDAVEERAGVVDRVDRHARHADVAAHPRVVGVVAAVGGQVEGDAQALLAGREVAAVERVGLLGGREAGVLPDRPRLGGVHRRVGPAQERREARPGVEAVEALEVLGAVDRQDVDALRAAPRLAARRVARRSSSAPGTSRRPRPHVGEALRNAHRASSSRIRPRKPSASTPMAHESSTSVDGALPRLAGQDDVRRPGRAQRRDEVGAPLGVRRVGAGEADDGLRRRRPRAPRRRRRSRRRPRRRRRRRRAGWWRRWRARCARRSGPSWRGRPARRRARPASPRRPRRSGGPARLRAGRRARAASRRGAGTR